MFQEMEIPYISGNGNPVKITYISGKKIFYISENQNPEKKFYISGNGTSLYSRKWKP